MHTPTVTTRDFIASLQPHTDKRLVFEHDSQCIQPGYHVTEIKAASFRSLDCGARSQQWEETIVQLWDVADKPHAGHMSVRKFLAIWRKVEDDVGLSGEAEIKFEWGDAAMPAAFYTLNSLREEGDLIIASLEPVRATCKPRDEWWLSKTPVSETSRLQSTNACCAPANAPQLIHIADTTLVASAGCCGNGAQGQGVACCN
jgi:hypothetical protein